MTGFLTGAAVATLFAVLAYSVYDATANTVIERTADRSVIVGPLAGLE